LTATSTDCESVARSPTAKTLSAKQRGAKENSPDAKSNAPTSDKIDLAHNLD